MSDLNQKQDSEVKPSWGAAVGVFFLCWFVGAICCAFASMAIASANGFTGYSVGGIATFIMSFVGAGIYRSTGKMGGAIIVAVIVGAVVGAAAAYIGMSLSR